MLKTSAVFKEALKVVPFPVVCVCEAVCIFTRVHAAAFYPLRRFLGSFGSDAVHRPRFRNSQFFLIVAVCAFEFRSNSLTVNRVGCPGNSTADDFLPALSRDGVELARDLFYHFYLD